MKRGERERRDGEAREQRYARLIAEDPEARAMIATSGRPLRIGGEPNASSELTAGIVSSVRQQLVTLQIGHI